MFITWNGQSIKPFAICRINRNLQSCIRAFLLSSVLVLVNLGYPVGRSDSSQLELVRDPTVENSVSPYVAKHFDDLILWQSLAPRSLELARRLDRPLLISSGYLSCYWCHRMTEDTFSNPELAEFINDHFVPVIMDREVHVEEDRTLQLFMQDTHGISGWPVTVIMIPRGYPVFGYSYTDPKSLKSSLSEFMTNWNRSAHDITESAIRDSQIRHSNRSSKEVPIQGLPSLDLLQRFLIQANAATDMTYGGFGMNAKFPFVPQMNILVELSALNPDPEVMAFIETTLDAMLDSAIIDPIEGGMFRYSETRSWDKPHFEQMLYSQALMSKLLLRASSVLKNDRYREDGLRMLDHIVKNFKMDNGWYASSLSALSTDGIDGGYYFWHPSQLEETLGDDWMFNVEDRLPSEKSILPAPLAGDEEVRKSLLQRRSVRPQIRDNKPVLSWNGLVLSAMAYGAALDDRFVDHAQALANLLIQEAWADGLSTVAGGQGMQSSTLETYILVASGLFDWWQLSNNPSVYHQVLGLLTESLVKFRQGDHWMEAEALLPEAGQRIIAIPDRQIPSASGEWYRLAMLMRSIDPESAKPLAETMHRMEVVQSPMMHDEAFYHATFILARLLRELSVSA